MDDYIKREDAINTVRNTFTGMTADTLELRINGIPSADVAPVVRCKDCKNYAFADNRVPQERVWWCYYWGYEIGADDFCSMGERKDDD